MTISVIIPTYNGAHKLPDIIQAVKMQTIKPDEVLVVVDGSTDDTINVLQSLKYSLDFKIVEQENKGRAAVRNKGASEATKDLLLFLDDDMLPLKDCIKEHLIHHQEFRDSLLTGAQVDLPGDKYSEIQNYKSVLSNKWIKTLKEKGKQPLAKEEIFITAANFSVSRKVFFDLNGFDESLKDAEDFDIAVRAFKKGYNIFYKYNAFAWHNDPVIGITYVKRLRQYRNAHQYLLNAKPELYKDMKQLSSTLPQGVKKTVFNFFAKKYWIEWMDKSTWKIIIPRKIRYKLYDVILTANGVYFPEKVTL